MMPADALSHLGDSMVQGGSSGATVQVAMSGARQFLGWLRQQGMQIPEIANPHKDRWKVQPPVPAFVPPQPPANDIVGQDMRSAIAASAAQRRGGRQAAAWGGGQRRASADSNVLPVLSSISVWRRSPTSTGGLMHVRDYNARDLAGAGSIEHFLRTWVMPTHEGPWHYQIVETLPNGTRKPPYDVELQGDSDMGAGPNGQGGLAGEVRDLRASLDVDKQVERFTKIKEAVQSMTGDQSPESPMVMAMRMWEMRETMKAMNEMMHGPAAAAPPPPPPPGPDPLVAKLEAKIERLEERLANKGGGMADLIALSGAMQAPLLKVLELQGSGKKGGLSDLLEGVNVLKQLGVPVGGDASGELVKLSGNVAAIIAGLKTLPVPDNKGAAAPAFVPPAGFKEKCDAMKAATDAGGRLAAASEALELLAKGSDPRFAQLMAWLLERSRAAVAAADGDPRKAIHAEMLDRIQQIISALEVDKHIDAVTRDATVDAFRAYIEPLTQRLAALKVAA